MTPTEAISRQWPKRCACSRVWTATFRPTICLGHWGLWQDLTLIGHMETSWGKLELRNCRCGSSIAAMVECYDVHEATREAAHAG